MNCFRVWLVNVVGTREFVLNFKTRVFDRFWNLLTKTSQRVQNTLQSHITCFSSLLIALCNQAIIQVFQVRIKTQYEVNKAMKIGMKSNIFLGVESSSSFLRSFPKFKPKIAGLFLAAH